MKNILLLTDFSDPSKNAIAYALQLFSNTECTFHVLCVQDSSAYITDDVVSQATTSLYDSLVNKNRLKLIDYVAELESEFDTKSISFKVIVDYDSLIDAVQQNVTSNDIELIVMGTSGATGAKEVIFGSNTLQIVRNIQCNTLIVPKDYEYQHPKALLLALNPPDLLSGRTATDFFQFLQAHTLKLHVLRFTEDTERQDVHDQDTDVLNTQMHSTSYQYHQIAQVPMVYAVGTYLQTHAIDMIGLFAHRETFLERLFLGSATTEMCKHAEFPLLIFHT
ncbi:universal stress protein [Gelidibacter salicanalis]|uniref:Universal stress protein n=1 Tax=Gelidibacter salicanalis TaxID=291193 RepID=A0A5C7ANU9_9FLAO|nr:universal stress protein [Gelidibacter salicanalis]TXE10456.1 universal stress protein [Gelidibacter salicanalis]